MIDKAAAERLKTAREKAGKPTPKLVEYQKVHIVGEPNDG